MTDALRDLRYGLVMTGLLVLLCGGAALSPAAGGPRRDLVVVGTLVTMDDRLGVVRGGRLVVSRGRIMAVLRRGEAPPAAARGYPVVRVDGFVYPGLINAHNHLAYNALPPWPPPLVNGRPLRSEEDWRAGEGAYAAVTSRYVESVSRPKGRLIEAGLAAEAGKWAELRELAAGTTTTQGSFGFRTESGDEGSDGFGRHLARNLDFDPGIWQGVPGIYDEQHRLRVDLLAAVLEAVREGRARTFVLHLSEGRVASKRHELYDLGNFGRPHGTRCGPLLRRAVVIHGTPYGAREFRLMAACGADLVASPFANLLFYGRAPDVVGAIRAGVNVSLGTDWSIVGSRNLLEELKVVDHVMGGRLSARTLVDMVTRNPARAIGWERRVGRLAPGLQGDLVAVQSSVRDPYRALIEATERDVALVAVAGDPLFGDVDLLARLKPQDHEVVHSGCGFAKALDATTPFDVPEGDDRFEEIEAALRRGLDSVGVDSRGVSPIFTCADREHFEMVERARALDFFDARLERLLALVRSSFGVR